MFLAGLDLGQAGDPTALAIAEVSVNSLGVSVYQFRHLERVPLGSSYPDIVDLVHERWTQFKLMNTDSILCVDYTGVGRPVVDLFLRRAEIPIRPITITGGSNVGDNGTGWHTVPKKDLAAVVQILLRRRRLHVASALKEATTLRKELQNFRVKITTSGNETFECLVGSTLVETDRGPVAIKNIRAGNLVLTRKGLRRVLWSGETKRVNQLVALQLSNGKQIVGTGDHLVWTKQRKWVSLSHVGSHDDLIGLEETQCHAHWKQQKSSPSTGSCTENHPAENTSFEAGQEAAVFRSTAMCGFSTTARSPKATTYTTRMATPRTTTFPTWSVSPSRTTGIDISREESEFARSAVLFLIARVASATCVLGSARQGQSSRSRSSARDAGRRFRPSILTPCSVRPCAGRLTGTRIAERQEIASDAEKHSGPNTRCPNTVRAVAPSSIVNVFAEPVYDLVVEDQHEFFANGVLVHNSWREGDHDDLVLAAAMPCWLGERTVLGAFSVSGGGGGYDGADLMSQAPPGVFGGDDRGRDQTLWESPPSWGK